MKILKALAASALMFGATLVLADPPAQVGRLNYLSGVVSFAPAEANTDWSAAVLNRPVTAGDRLWADADGRAEMHVGSTAIRIPALTSLDVLSLDERGTQLRLAQGSVNVRLRSLDAGENFEISTPVGAVLFVQPGSYRVIVDPSRTALTVAVHRGQADVLTGGAPFTVRSGQLAAVSTNGSQLHAAPQLDEFDSWSMARDRREDNLAATRYVPQEMTGHEDLDQYGTWSSEEQYGTVWYPTAVAADWAPYRHGHWVWISPWGWTWVDDAPWGFAPSHYGRWVWLRNRWAWAPGARIARPVYAPALVAFIGGNNWSVSVGGGPAVGWVPLGWREPYIPWYRASPAYVRNVNVTHVTNINVINQYSNARNGNNIRYANRGVPSATTVVAREAFVSGRRADRASVTVPAQVLASARITHEAPVARPARASPMASRPRVESPEATSAREVSTAKAPPTPARVDGGGNAGNGRVPFAQNEDRARERAMSPRQRTDAPMQQPAARTPVAPQPAPQVQRQAQQNEQRRLEQQEERRLQQQRSQAEQRVRQEEYQRQMQQQRVQQQQKERVQQEERQRQLQQQRGQAEQQARQRLQQDESRRQLQQRAQQQIERAQQEERQRQLAQQQARHNQVQQQRAQQEQRQRMQQERSQREQRQAERAPESRPQPTRQSRDQFAKGVDR